MCKVYIVNGLKLNINVMKLFCRTAFIFIVADSFTQHAHKQPFYCLQYNDRKKIARSKKNNGLNAVVIKWIRSSDMLYNLVHSFQLMLRRYFQRGCSFWAISHFKTSLRIFKYIFGASLVMVWSLLLLSPRCIMQPFHPRNQKCKQNPRISVKKWFGDRHWFLRIFLTVK